MRLIGSLSLSWSDWQLHTKGQRWRQGWNICSYWEWQLSLCREKNNVIHVFVPRMKYLVEYFESQLPHRTYYATCKFKLLWFIEVILPGCCSHEGRKLTHGDWALKLQRCGSHNGGEVSAIHFLHCQGNSVHCGDSKSVGQARETIQCTTSCHLY